MKTMNLNMMAVEIESKIFDALISLGLKSPKVLENYQECHFITQNKIYNKNQSNYSLQNFARSPVKNKPALESVRILTFILRPDCSGRRIFSEKETLSFKFYDTLPFPLN